MAKDGQDVQELSSSGENNLRVGVANNLEARVSESYNVKEAEGLLSDEDRQEASIERSLSFKREVAEEGERVQEEVEREVHGDYKEKSVVSREVEVIGTTPENSEEADKEEATAMEEGGEDREATVSEQALQPDDINANVEMPAIAKDLPQVPDDMVAAEEKPIVSEPVQVDDNTEQEARAITEPKVTSTPGRVNEEKRIQERKLDGDASSVPITHITHHRVGKIGWNGRKNAGIEDPHGVQEVLDGLPLWREDSQPLRANYPTTTAYRVAIKKKRSITMGNTIFLLFCIMLLVGVVGSFFVYFVRSVSTAVSETNLPVGEVQEAQPTNRAGVSTAGAETTAPASNGHVLAGYQWINGGTKHELYIDTNNHIQELASSDGQNWQITDLTKRSGAAVANGRTLTGFEWQHGNSELVVYIDAKRHIQQLSSSGDGQWNVMDLTRKAQAPLASGTAITGYEWTQGGSEQVVYIDQRSHIQELASTDGTNWRTSDLTALTKAPPASGNIIAGYQWEKPGSQQVDYIDINHHVHELSFIVGSWQDTDLNSLVGAPLANGKTLVGYEWRQTGVSQIGYLDTNNHIRLLSSASAGNWSLVDLTQLVKAPVANGNTLVGYEWQQGGCNVLYFIDGSNHIQEISDAPGEDWQLADLNQFTLSAPPPNGKALFGYDWAQQGSKQVVYIDTTNTVRELTSGKWNLSRWKQK